MRCIYVNQTQLIRLVSAPGMQLNYTQPPGDRVTRTEFELGAVKKQLYN